MKARASFGWLLFGAVAGWCGCATQRTDRPQVATSAESVAGFRFEPIAVQRLRVPFNVLLAAVDTNGQVVDGFAGTVTLTGVDGAVLVVSEPFALGRGKAEVTIVAAGSWILTADDALGHRTQSGPFEVRAGPPVRARVLEAPSSAAAGACAGPLRFQFEDALGNAADLQAAVPISLGSLPEGTAFFLDSSCAHDGGVTAVAVSAPGELYFRPGSAGALQLHLIPDGLVHASHVLEVTP